MSKEIHTVINEYLPLRDVVFQTLRQTILRGELKPGERLMEVHLAERLGVSRTPIREAIRKLELEGLVVMIPRRGAVVASITEKDLKDVLEVRRTLEILAGEVACERITPELLKEKCAQLGLGCDIIPKVEIGDITVSSTYIRRLLELGQTERAARFLGHPHTLAGTVRHGRGVGSTRLFPTANLVIPSHVLVPSHGVYVTRVYLPDGNHYAAVTNVGTRPTLDNGTDITVEACILDFQGDLYGQTLRVEFYRHLRDEMRFDSLDALRTRIAADAETTRRYFEENPV